MNTTIKNASVGRARGHSMLSALKATEQMQSTGEESQQGHPGISFKRLQAGQAITKVAVDASIGRPSLVHATGRIVSESRVSALTMALQAAGLDEESGPPPTTVTPPIAIPSDATPALSPTVSDSESEEDIPIEPAVSCYEKLDLRKWCTGQPPKRLYFKSDRGRALPPRFRMSRRNTLGDRPELDILLAATKVEYNGHSYLPLTAQTIHRLDPFFKGAKPLADMKVFECIIINQEVNGVHADHVVTALERIGEHCKHLLVMSPVQTSELGNVFAREAGLINTGNDWDAILECFPNVNYIAFVHDLEKPVGFSRNTFRGLQTAVANRQATQEELKGFSASIPPALLM